MKIKKLEESNNTLKLKITDIDIALANALRRIMIADTKCYAVDTVDFYKNDCFMSMEEIAHRLGLLPLKSELDTNTVQPTIFLDFTATEPLTNIFAKDLVYTNIEPVYPDMPITVLKKGETLKFTANVTYNSKNAGGHAKWSPATVVFYSYENSEFLFTIETTGSVTPENLFTQALTILEDRVQNILKC
jgi:DNA-directed RNA polymerase subunit D